MSLLLLILNILIVADINNCCILENQPSKYIFRLSAAWKINYRKNHSLKLFWNIFFFCSVLLAHKIFKQNDQWMKIEGLSITNQLHFSYVSSLAVCSLIYSFLHYEILVFTRCSFGEYNNFWNAAVTDINVYFVFLSISWFFIGSLSKTKMVTV